MYKRLLFLIISATILVALYGCHAGGSSPMAPDNSAVTVSPETRFVDDDGRFDDIIFPSGAIIKCPNKQTFQKGVKVVATEEKVPLITDNSGTYSYIYLYNISAVLPSENSLSAEVPVNTIEKPLSVTLPNDSTAGTCYVGTRANESDPWHYSLVTDGVNSNARFMRLSANPPKSCTFNLYKLNIQFRLFVFDNEEKKDEVQVDTVTLAPAEDVETKDGKYTGKLTVKLNVEGENLNGIKAEDLVAKIIYRSENQQGANISFTNNHTDSSDKAVTGGYEHSFEITNIKIDNSLGNTAELSFELNLDGVSLEDFPKDFLVEFYSKGSDENTRPFEYTQTFGFETKEPDNPDNPDPQPVTTYTITYNLDGGQLTEDNPSNYTVETESFTLNNPTKDNFTFLGWTYEGQTTPQTTISINTGSTGDKTFTANWEPYAVVSLKSASTDFPISGTNIQLEFDKEINWQNSYANNITITPTTTTTPITTSSFSYSNKILTITLSNKLKYNTEYKVAVADMPKVVDKNLTFTTVALNVTPQIASTASDIVVVNKVNRHILQPTFTIDFGKEVINQTTAKNSILLNTNALPNSCNLAFDENGKIATLTFTANLELFTDYSLNITAFTDDDNSAVKAQSLSFKTIPPDDILGEGSENKPFLIYTQTHLNKLRERSPVNYFNGNYYFKQMDDIILTSENWVPIGKENNDDFYGKYDGYNHKITGLKINNGGDSLAGLFWGIVGSDDSNRAEIKNLTFENAEISNGNYVGILAGKIRYAEISNVNITGNINIKNSNEFSGGLAGKITKSTIENIHLSGEISIKGSGFVGGLVGQCDEVQITGCSVDSPDGLIDVDTGYDVGGLVGRVDDSGITSISKSYASIRVQGRSCVGGLVGAMANCIIENSYSETAITAKEKDQSNGPTSIGGFVGSVNAENASFNNCYSKGTIYIKASESKKASNVGGLAGSLGKSNLSSTTINSTNSFTYVTISVSDGFTPSGYNPYNPADERGSVPLYYKDYGSGRGYIYEDDTNYNYLSNGYPADKLNWDSSVWDNLTAGAYPTLKQN